MEEIKARYDDGIKYIQKCYTLHILILCFILFASCIFISIYFYSIDRSNLSPLTIIIGTLFCFLTIIIGGIWIGRKYTSQVAQKFNDEAEEYIAKHYDLFPEESILSEGCFRNYVKMRTLKNERVSVNIVFNDSAFAMFIGINEVLPKSFLTK